MFSRTCCFLLLLCLPVSFGLWGCASGPAGQGGPVRLELTASGGVANLVPGQELVVTLESNPSTGYDWRVTKLPEELLEKLQDEYIAPENAVVGQGGTRRFVFKALKPGSSVLEMAYYRPWEDTDRAADWFQLIVEIRSPEHAPQDKQ